MITNLLHQAFSLIEAHPYWGMMFAFIISFLESLPIVGTIFPGSVTMTAVGTLIGTKALPWFSTLLLASIGAFLGDLLGYYLGKYAESFIRSHWPFNQYPQWIEKGEYFFQKHGGKSILIGRFIGPARSTVPMIAGLLKMKTPLFFTAAIPSAILWALAYISPGILLGALSLSLSPQKVAPFIMVGLIIIVFSWLICWLAFQVSHYIARLVNVSVGKLWARLSKRRHRLINWIVRKEQPSDHSQLLLLILALIAAMSFLILWLSVIFHGALTQANRPLFLLLQSLHTNRLDDVMVVFTLLGQKPVMLSMALLLSIGLIFQRQYSLAWHLLALTMIGCTLIGGFKLIFYSPRPQGIWHQAIHSSFPSGHAALSLMIFGFLAFILVLHSPRAWHGWIYTTMTITALLVGLSRMYLGAHWLTDILGSWTLGMALLLLSILHYRHRYAYALPPNKPIKHQWSISILAWIIPWMVYGNLHFSQTKQAYRPYEPLIVTRIDQWWKHPLRFALYRNNRIGKPIEPLNVQWAARFDEIKHQLMVHGWSYQRPRFNLKTTLNRLTKSAPIHHMPIIHELYHGHLSRGVFYKKIKHKKQIILELRLWPSHIQFSDHPKPLWIGTLDYHDSIKNKLFHLYQQKHLFKPNNEIALIIPALVGMKYTIIFDHHAIPKTLAKSNWDRKILLVRSKKPRFSQPN